MSSLRRQSGMQNDDGVENAHDRIKIINSLVLPEEFFLKDVVVENLTCFI